MQNLKFLWSPSPGGVAPWLMIQGLFPLTLVAYGLAFFQLGPLPAMAVGGWAFAYLLNFPAQIWYVAHRPEGGEVGRTAKILALGACPLGFFLLLWAELTTRTGLLVMYPVVAVCGVAAMWIASLNKAPRPVATEPAEATGPTDTP